MQESCWLLSKVLNTFNVQGDVCTAAGQNKCRSHVACCPRSRTLLMYRVMCVPLQVRINAGVMLVVVHGLEHI